MKSLQNSLFLGLIKVHILHHAAERPVYGLWLVEELGRHGYRLSFGTLYPTLHAMEADDLLRSEAQTVNGKVRKYYTTTAKGRRALALAQKRIRELVAEVVSGPHTTAASANAKKRQSRRR